MVQISKKIRLMIIDRFYINTNELPHEISFSHTEDKWKVFNCKSSNHSHEIGYKKQSDEVALFS